MDKRFAARKATYKNVPRRGVTPRQRSVNAIIKRALRAPLSGRTVMSKETGFLDVAAATYVYDTTGSIALLNTIAQGVTVNQRVGKKIIMKSIQIRGNHYAGASGTVAEGAMLIVYDKRPTGALPAITDILNSVSPNAFNNDANSGRFRIVRRRDLTFTGNSTTPATGNEYFDASDFIKLNLPVTYKAAGTGAIADIEEGALYVVTVGDKVAGATAGGAALGFRTRFLDN